MSSWLLSAKSADFTDAVRILRPLSVKRADFTDGKDRSNEKLGWQNEVMLHSRDSSAEY